jgi:hypothetical protein
MTIHRDGKPSKSHGISQRLRSKKGTLRTFTYEPKSSTLKRPDIYVNTESYASRMAIAIMLQESQTRQASLGKQNREYKETIPLAGKD